MDSYCSGRSSEYHPSPCQQNWTHYTLYLCQDVGNNHLSTDLGYNNHSCINFPFHCDLNQVDSSTNLLDKVVLPEVVTQPTKKLRSVGPQKSISKKNRNKKKSSLENKKFKSVSKPIYEISVDPSGDKGNIPQQHLVYTNKDKKNYPLVDTGTSVPIVSWKLIKKRSHIISDISIPGRVPHSRFSQRFKLNAESPSMLEKDLGLLYRLIERLLLRSKLLG